MVGGSSTGIAYHAFRTAPNSPINLATVTSVTLSGSSSEAKDINDSAIGWVDESTYSMAANSGSNFRIVDERNDNRNRCCH